MNPFFLIEPMKISSTKIRARTKKEADKRSGIKGISNGKEHRESLHDVRGPQDGRWALAERLISSHWSKSKDPRGEGGRKEGRGGREQRKDKILKNMLRKNFSLGESLRSNQGSNSGLISIVRVGTELWFILHDLAPWAHIRQKQNLEGEDWGSTPAIVRPPSNNSQLLGSLAFFLISQNGTWFSDMQTLWFYSLLLITDRPKHNLNLSSTFLRDGHPYTNYLFLQLQAHTLPNACRTILVIILVCSRQTPLNLVIIL